MRAVEMPSPVMLCPRGLPRRVTQPAGADAGPRWAGWSDRWPFLGSSMKSDLETPCAIRGLFVLIFPASHSLPHYGLPALTSSPVTVWPRPSGHSACWSCPHLSPSVTPVPPRPPEQLPVPLVCGFLPCPASSLTVEFTEAQSWAPVSSLFGHLSGRSVLLIQWMDFMHKKLH